jgi:probable HAF family extracellular repeat protein
VWTDAAASSGLVLSVLPGDGGAAFAINRHRQVAGLQTFGGAFFAVRWDGPGQNAAWIGALPSGISSEVVAINRHGDTAGRTTFPDGSVHAMLHVRRTNALLDLGALAGNYSEARAVNADRVVVGSSNAGPGVAHAFLWQEGTLHDLNSLVVWTSEPIAYLSNAVAIDDEGRIAAEAVVLTASGLASRMALLTP